MEHHDHDLELHAIGGFAEAREEWTELAHAGGNVFATWEWASLWWQHYGGGGRLELTAVRRGDGTPVAVLPLYRWSKGPLKLLRFVGHGPADQLGPVCAPADVPPVGRVLRCALDDGRWSCDGLLAETLAGDEHWDRLLGVSVLAVEGSPVCSLRTSGWEDFLATLSRNHRKQVRREERRLADQFDLRFRLTADPAELAGDMDTFFRLHDARWQGRSAAADDQQRGFTREFAAIALAEGWLRLWTMELSGRPAAAWLGFRYGAADLFYQQGRDPDLAGHNVGGVLEAHTIRAAIEDGMAEYRFLRGDEAFKYRYADRDPGLSTLVRPASPLGSLVVGSVSALSRTGPGRRVVTRLAGAG